MEGLERLAMGSLVRAALAVCLGVVGIKACSAQSVEVETPSAVDASGVVCIDNNTVRIGVDRTKGGAICWLSSQAAPRNIVNVSDPGRLIQQSYYAGKSLVRTAEGQHKAWSPWTWNPIQGGGVGSWAEATHCEVSDGTIFTESTPKLWDMHNEDAQATMRQWLSFEPGRANVVRVRCQLESIRDDSDRWGEVGPRPQELPACYFVRSYSKIASYAGGGMWRDVEIRPGPPWGKTIPELKAMAMFNRMGQGVALFSPSATEHWNVGPHASGKSDEPTAKPCMHIAPIGRVMIPRRSTFEYRYWLVVGSRVEIAASLEGLIVKYSRERARLGRLEDCDGGQKN